LQERGRERESREKPTYGEENERERETKYTGGRQIVRKRERIRDTDITVYKPMTVRYCTVIKKWQLAQSLEILH
jgi:hypothetical protein